MREGHRRLAQVLRWAGWAWIIIVCVVASQSGEFKDAEWYERLAVGALILAPGYVALGAAWVIEGYAQDRSSKERHG